MIHRLDDRLREEARRYRLVFACPDCASFDPGDPGGDEEPGDPGQAGNGARSGDRGDPGRAGNGARSGDRGGPARARHEPRCSLGYPVAPHLDRALDDRDAIVFCKAFELR